MLPDDTRIISVDDHVIEHPRVWLDRLASKYEGVAPRIVVGHGQMNADDLEEVGVHRLAFLRCSEVRPARPVPMIASVAGSGDGMGTKSVVKLAAR